jgi:hypothetical protein
LRPAAAGPDGGDQRRASGREKHTQKITVYLSAEELLDLERARLALLRYGAAADRGRIVREAIAVLLADLDARGQESLLARRIASGITAGANGTSENISAENVPISAESLPVESVPIENGAIENGASQAAPDQSVVNRTTLSGR